MTAKTALPFGSWPSPITPSLVLSSSISLIDLLVQPRSSTSANTRGGLLWLEGRPEEKGRQAIVFQAGHDGNKEEVLPADTKWNARTRVHEYGGASVVWQDANTVLFSSMEGPVYSVERSRGGTWSEPKQVTQDSDVLRYANFSPHPTSPSRVLSILEDHTNDTPSTVVNSLVLLNTSTKTYSTIASGNDFYSTPSWSASGSFISWIEWSHPDMPWDGSELWIARVDQVTWEVVEGSQRKIAGLKGGKESVSQARWSLEGTDGELLVFLSDRTGYYELYKWEATNGTAIVVESVLSEPTGADVGGPDWQLGQSTHAALSPTTWISRAASGQLRLIDLASRKSTLYQTNFASIAALRVISPTVIALIASPQVAPSQLVTIELPSSFASSTPLPEPTIVQRSSSASLDSDYISVGKPITFPTSPSTECGTWPAKENVAHAIFYPATNKRSVGQEGEKSPLLVKCHGGPTSAAGRGLDWSIQYLTSRGFAVVDVNYSGSTSYGRTFRSRLLNNWGLIDVSDTVSCVEYLVKEGLVDEKRVAISGGSAGGFTVLAALCRSPETFAAGISWYGISDLDRLADDTHKFESQYLFNLLGGTPETVPQVYHDRSPINISTSIRSPLLLLQGSIDRVVPLEQATLMLERVRAQKGGKCELEVFDGEGHGFRGREAKEKAMRRELGWLRSSFGIETEEEE